MSAPLRGQIYRVDIGFGPKPWLVVSNNHRNRALSDLLAARITTTDRHANLPTWVPLGTSDPLVGYVNTDDLQQLHRDDSTICSACSAPRHYEQSTTHSASSLPCHEPDRTFSARRSALSPAVQP